MAMTPDQIMMFAHLADWAGSKMASDNPFAGYAQQFVGARNYAKMLQPGAAPGAPGAGPGVTPIADPNAPAAGGDPSALAQPSPFSPEASLYGKTPTPEMLYNFTNTPGAPFAGANKPGGIPALAERNEEAAGAVTPGVNQLFEPGSIPESAWEKGSKHTITFDEDNNRTDTTQRKSPAQIHAGAPTKKEAPQKQQNLPSSVTNPFWSLG